MARPIAEAGAKAPAAATPTLDPATIDAIAQRVAGQIDVKRDEGVKVRPGMAVRVRRPVPGSSYEDVKMETDRIFTLRGTRNDEKLVRLGYLEAFSGEAAYACRVCGAEFASQRGRENHGRAEHEPKSVLAREVPLNSPLHRDRTTYSEEDVARENAVQAAVGKQAELAEEARDRRLDEEAPLYLDKTAASRK